MNSTIPATAVPVHRPRGVEHPYATSADQLVPPIPLAGAPLRIGAVCPGSTAMTVEVVWADGGTQAVEMQRSDSGAAQAIAMAGGDGHLGAAQAASLDTPDAWTCVLPALADRPGRYRFHADGVPVSDWFGLDPARWHPAGDRLVTGAGERLVPGSVEVLAGSGEPLRLRFALRLHADDHVVGFGERFDAVDQRGIEPAADQFSLQIRQALRHCRTGADSDTGRGNHVVFDFQHHGDHGN